MDEHAFYLIEKSKRGPEVIQFFGPFADVHPVTWFAPQADEECNVKAEYGPEKEFPSSRHYRSPGFLCSSCRPPLACPRTLGLQLQFSGPQVGTAPAGYDFGAIPLFAAASLEPSTDATYESTAVTAGLYRARLQVDPNGYGTRRVVEPTGRSDYPAELDYTLEDTAGARWRLYYQPTANPGQDIGPREPIRAALTTGRDYFGDLSPIGRKLYLSGSLEAQELCPVAINQGVTYFNETDFVNTSVSFGFTGGATPTTNGITCVGESGFGCDVPMVYERSTVLWEFSFEADGDLASLGLEIGNIVDRFATIATNQTGVPFADYLVDWFPPNDVFPPPPVPVQNGVIQITFVTHFDVDHPVGQPTNAWVRVNDGPFRFWSFQRQLEPCVSFRHEVFNIFPITVFRTRYRQIQGITSPQWIDQLPPPT